jgi:hypothetical protein
VLLLVLTLFVVIVSLYFSVVVSRHRKQIERLVEEVALLDEQIRTLRAGSGGVPVEIGRSTDRAQRRRAQSGP